MIDIIFPTHNRLEFTKESLAALIANTDWKHVRRMVIYDDASVDGTREWLATAEIPKVKVIHGEFGGPVAVMNHYLISGEAADVFAKIDNDTVVPPGWLTECLTVMRENPEVDLLGIEAFRPVVAGQAKRNPDDAKFIGGIGLMRARAFITLPRPGGRFGFTAWQERAPWVKKAWLNPALPVFLLDRLPMDPWRKLSKGYIAQGWQREWPVYPHSAAPLWKWWTP
jgi:glycosyltransferase involved in cell wall biosynthesis